MKLVNLVVGLSIFVFANLLLMFVISNNVITTSDFVGQATSSSGNVSLDISSYASIYLNDSMINFGSCSINTTKNFSLFDSYLSGSSGDNVLCENSSLPDKIIVVNDGTINLNLSVRINVLPSVVLNDSNAWMAFKSLNNTLSPGCVGSLHNSYENFTSTSINYELCSNFTCVSQSKIDFYVETYVTNQSSGELNASLQFVGASI